MPEPRMEPVDSSNIEAIGYDPGSRSLYIRFLSGTSYVYSEVDEWVHQELMQADSKGSYFNRQIKPNYTYAPL